MDPVQDPVPSLRTGRRLEVLPRADLLQRSDRTLEAARDYMLSIQEEPGYWCGELEGDCILQSEFILTMHCLGRSGEARPRKAAEYLRRQQLQGGGWAIFEGGPPEVSASAKAYFVLKLLGDDPEAEHMVKARRTILALGGLEACNTFTQIYLALFGQYPWNRCPAVPPEMILLPRWAPLNIYRISSWSRTIVVPLSIIWAKKPHFVVPEEAGIQELLTGAMPRSSGVHRFVGTRFWTVFFRSIDASLKLIEKLPAKPLRRWALARCEEWTLQRLQKSDGLGAIFPPIVNTIIALRALDYPVDHPVLNEQVQQLERLIIEEEETLRVQPCLSPVWDTSIALNALLEAGLPKNHDGALAAADWLLDREVRDPGDWHIHAPHVEPGGWYFEYANEFYPDCDDTAEVLMGLARVRFPAGEHEDRRRGAIDRGLRWLLSMQNKDGGWAAFDKDCDQEIFTHIPFADHNAMLDPSCEDITARVLDCLDILGYGQEHEAVRRAIDYLFEKQQPDGTWYGRWGCNYIYGTWLALWGLRAIGVPADDERLRKGGDWLLQHQNDDGGWGETPASYDDPGLRGHGPSTAAQTAWALMALIALGEHDAPAVSRGVQFLVENQLEDGSWYDEPWTGTGFPRVFYLRYHLYATYFPLMALAVHRKALQGKPLR